MSLFGDNQTKHFYALKSTDSAAVKDLQNSNLFTIAITNDGAVTATTDVIDRKLIKSIKVNEVKPVYYRNWTVAAPSAITVGNTYHIYFYLENMLGFGMQDRWDRVASYTAKSGDNVTTVMTALKNDLDLKLNGAGPIKGDFTVTSGSSNSIVVAENPASETYKFDKLDMYMHGNPYVYHVTMSTFDGTEAWGGQKEITATNTNTVRISAAMKVLDMEHYFLRNRADRYDLMKDFWASIINKTYTDESAAAYYTLDIDYAFSDTQGYTYHSDKQLTIACPTQSVLTTLKSAILTDSNNNSYSESESEGE